MECWSSKASGKSLTCCFLERGGESSEKGQEFTLDSLQPIRDQDDLLLKASTPLFPLRIQGRMWEGPKKIHIFVL